MATPQPVEAKPVEQVDAEVIQETTALAVHGADPTGLLSIIRTAAENKTDPATMRELLNVYKDAQAQRAEEAYAEAIVQFRRAVRPIIMTGLRDDTKIKKRNSNEYGTVRYPYAELTTTIEQIQSILDQCQLTPTWRMVKDEPNYLALECIVTHVLKHKESSGPFGSPVGEGRTGQTPVQVRQGVVTSLKRATLFMALGLTTKEDDKHLQDAEQGAEEKKPQSPADPEADTKKAFWNACQQKAGVKFTASQVRGVFQTVKSMCGSEHAADCLAFIQRDDILVGTDGSVEFAGDIHTGAEPDFQAPAAADIPHGLQGGVDPASTSPQPPSFPLFVCLTCGLGHNVRPAGGKCLGREGAKCAGKVVPNSGTWECKSGHKFAYEDIKTNGAAPKGICPVCDKAGKIMAGIEPAQTTS